MGSAKRYMDWAVVGADEFSFAREELTESGELGVVAAFVLESEEAKSVVVVRRVEG